MKRRLRAAFSCTWTLPLALALLAGGCVHRPAQPGAVELAAPPQDWAQLEGKRVRIHAPLTVSGHYRLARDGELEASFNGRLAAPTEVAEPGPAALAVAADNARRSMTISGAALATGEGGSWYLPDGTPSLRTGSVLTGVEGWWNNTTAATACSCSSGRCCRPHPGRQRRKWRATCASRC